uniref:Ig-like domain-containing protein n=1 Tax=Strigamia maritima TaxID=126957 RepID=T1J2G2_STRMM
MQFLEEKYHSLVKSDNKNSLVNLYGFPFHSLNILATICTHYYPRFYTTMDCTRIFIILFILPISNCDHFKQFILDIEYVNSNSPIILPCQVNSSVIRACGWLKNGSPLVMEHGKHEMHGDASIGACSLYIYQPQIGEDTTFYNCNPIVEYTESLISLPYRVLARKGIAKISRPPYSISFEVSENGSPINRKITVTGLVGATTKLRWFIDGEAKTANVLLTDKPRQMSQIDSSVAVVSKSEPVLVHYCIEVKTNTIYKEIFIGAVYVIGDTYQISDFPEPLIRTLPFKITPPKLRMFWSYKGKETMVNDNRIILNVNNIKDGELTLKCVDIAASPAVYLKWGLIDPNGNAEVIDEGSEFKLSPSSGEMIKARVKFLYSSHHINLQCQAKHVFHESVERHISVVVTVREHDACFAAQSSSATVLNNNDS